jgi:hypothetical protein
MAWRNIVARGRGVTRCDARESGRGYEGSDVVIFLVEKRGLARSKKGRWGSREVEALES